MRCKYTLFAFVKMYLRLLVPSRCSSATKRWGIYMEAPFIGFKKRRNGVPDFAAVECLVQLHFGSCLQAKLSCKFGKLFISKFCRNWLQYHVVDILRHCLPSQLFLKGKGRSVVLVSLWRYAGVEESAFELGNEAIGNSTPIQGTSRGEYKIEGDNSSEG